jgi:hypothetical protein
VPVDEMTDSNHISGSERPGLWERIRTRWGVTGWGAVAILVAFALAGMTVLRISKPIVYAIVSKDAPGWQYWTVKILVIIPIYELLLLGYGTLLGQRRFFFDKLMRLPRLVARIRGR